MADPVNMEKRIGQYVDIRDAIKRLDEKQAAERRPLLEIQERLAGILQQFMDANSLENLKTAAGTCYTTTRYTATVADADAFMDFVTTSAKFELLERRANATAVKEYVKTEGSLPAGVSLNGMTTVGVRRPAGKAKD